jgi:hypothetical protein
MAATFLRIDLRRFPAPLNEDAGSVVVAVALVSTLLLGIMGFAMDTGYLYMKKNQYRNAVEAAARAGAGALCGSDPEAAARRVAAENGVPDADDEGVLKVFPGYYDENNVYSESFSFYMDFETDPNPETVQNEAVPKVNGDCCQYNNAVMVMLERSEPLLVGGLHDRTSPAVVRAAAVAYLKRYDIIAGAEGLTVDPVFPEDYPHFHDTTIHANGDIGFQGAENFTGDGRVTATGEIVNCTAHCTEGVPEIDLKPLEMEMDALRERAQNEGTWIDAANWAKGDAWRAASFGRFKREGERSARIALASGDHGGAVYFLSAKSEDDQTAGVESIALVEDPDDPDRAAWNFTLATDAPFLKFQLAGALRDSIELGGEGEDVSRFYVDGQILFNPLYASGFGFNFDCRGVFFRCRQFQHRWYRRPDWEAEQKMRIIADEVTYKGFNNPNPLFDGLFGPPCPPAFIGMGRLLPAE